MLGTKDKEFWFDALQRQRLPPENPCDPPTHTRSSTARSTYLGQYMDETTDEAHAVLARTLAEHRGHLSEAFSG